MTVDAVEAREGCVFLRVRVQPKASRNVAKCEPGGQIRIALTAPPVDGAANKALRAFLAKTLGVPRRDVELVSGEKARDKVLRVQGLGEHDIRRKLFGS